MFYVSLRPFTLYFGEVKNVSFLTGMRRLCTQKSNETPYNTVQHNDASD